MVSNRKIDVPWCLRNDHRNENLTKLRIWVRHLWARRRKMNDDETTGALPSASPSKQANPTIHKAGVMSPWAAESSRSAMNALCILRVLEECRALAFLEAKDRLEGLREIARAEAGLNWLELNILKKWISMNIPPICWNFIRFLQNILILATFSSKSLNVCEIPTLIFENLNGNLQSLLSNVNFCKIS